MLQICDIMFSDQSSVQPTVFSKWKHSFYGYCEIWISASG